jgi:hypothetical protein
MALLEGMVVTQDMEIRGELLNLYRGGGIDTKGCAIVSGPSGPAINPNCGIIHEHLCAISADAISVRVATGRRDIAEQMKRSFINDYRCPSDPIDHAMAVKPGS